MFNNVLKNFQLGLFASEAKRLLMAVSASEGASWAMEHMKEDSVLDSPEKRTEVDNELKKITRLFNYKVKSGDGAVVLKTELEKFLEANKPQGSQILNNNMCKAVAARIFKNFLKAGVNVGNPKPNDAYSMDFANDRAMFTPVEAPQNKITIDNIFESTDEQLFQIQQANIDSSNRRYLLERKEVQADSGGARYQLSEGVGVTLIYQAGPSIDSLPLTERTRERLDLARKGVEDAEKMLNTVKKEKEDYRRAVDAAQNAADLARKALKDAKEMKIQGIENAQDLVDAAQLALDRAGAFLREAQKLAKEEQQSVEAKEKAEKAEKPQKNLPEF